ncbi:MAG TPA: isoaspartyl peptidase/L-asparaginase [Rhizomicrobium sp.]|nr:isoaspartyl peptidase/L-asparaginase [Rhizomicrobium sp.]
MRGLIGEEIIVMKKAKSLISRRLRSFGAISSPLATSVALFVALPAYADNQCHAQNLFAVVVHGGEISRRTVDNGRLAAMQAALSRARAQLAANRSSLDVVEEIVRGFEDSGVFNAGRGAIADAAGIVETDASIMDGRDQRSGAVASMLTIKNPVHAARLVMEDSPHVLLVGDRGEAFVKKLGAETVAPDYFLHNAHTGAPEHGTVGAVALDRCGHIAAATSTGGYDAKIPGRVGDSPIVGAGVYAEDGVAGFSATGHGEYFIRFSIAKDVSDRMAYAHQPMDEAMRTDIKQKLGQFPDADGALIGIDAHGHVAMVWNSTGLFRGYATDTEAPVVAEYDGPSASRR